MPEVPAATVPTGVSRKPLNGDEFGRYKILLVGNSGTGKLNAISLTWRQTTLGARLSQLLGVPHISLDTIHWGPNWQACPVDEFRAKVRERLDEMAETGWIIDGSYVSKLGSLVKDNAQSFTGTLGLDPPFILYFPRICFRTFARLVGYGKPCSPGCDESWRDVFSLGEKSILWWSWTRHDTCRVRYQVEMANEESRVKIRRLGGWGRELEDWIKDIQEMIRTV